MRNKNYIGIVDFHEDDEDEEKPRFCHHCLSFGVRSKLGPRILQKGEEPGPDWDLFMQCYSCGTIYGLHEIKTEQAVSGFAVTNDNPFDTQRGQVLGAHAKRSSPAGKKEAAKKRRERNRPRHKDKEIDELLRIYGDRVKIVYDSDP